MTSTFLSASSSSSFFSGGTDISYTEMVIAPRVEYLQPCAFMASSTSQVLALPCFSIVRSTICDSSLLVVRKSISSLKRFAGSVLSTKPRSCGMGWLKYHFAERCIDNAVLRACRHRSDTHGSGFLNGVLFRRAHMRGQPRHSL